MEASVAAGDAGTQQGQQGEGEAAAAFDPAQLNQTLAGLSSGLEALRGEVTQLRQPADGEGETEGDGELDLSFLQNLFGEEPQQQEFEPQQQQQVDPAAFQQQFAAAIQQAAQQAVAPVQQQVSEFARQQQAAQLVSEFPEMGQEETATQVAQAAIAFAGHLGEQHGLPPEVVAQIGSSPALWRVVYMAGNAAKSASDGVQQAQLEGGSGPGAGTDGQQDPAQMIVAAGGRSVLPFG